MNYGRTSKYYEQLLSDLKKGKGLCGTRKSEKLKKGPQHTHLTEEIHVGIPHDFYGGRGCSETREIVSFERDLRTL